MDDKLTPLLPARHVHIGRESLGTYIMTGDQLIQLLNPDQTPWSAAKRVSLHAPRFADPFKPGRVRIVKY